VVGEGEDEDGDTGGMVVGKDEDDDTGGGYVEVRGRALGGNVDTPCAPSAATAELSILFARTYVRRTLAHLIQELSQHSPSTKAQMHIKVSNPLHIHLCLQRDPPLQGLV